jgi:DNA-binding MarR family transcriptional regulator
MKVDYSIIASVRRIIRAVDVFSTKLKDRFGLTSSQITCLEYIDYKGACPISAISKALQLSPSMLTNIIDQLEYRHYIQRVRSEQDRRVILIELTDTGREVLSNLPESLNKQLLRGLDGIDEVEKEKILSGLNQILTFIQAEDLNSLPILATGSVAGEEEAEMDRQGNFEIKKKK